MLFDDELNEELEDILSFKSVEASLSVSEGLSLLGSVNENDGSESLIGITVRVFGLS